MISNHQELEVLFGRHGFEDFKWIDPHRIVVSQWVRMKCMYGCRHYGRKASCPPNLPTVSECRDFFWEYRAAVVFHFPKAVALPEDRHAWSKEVNLALLRLERDLFLNGYQKAFLLFMDSCGLCDECVTTREHCKQPQMARPAPEGMGVDVYTTVRQYGYPIEVLSDFAQEMNRYAFLFIE
jgi:predicted metal-binding protein